MSSKLKPSGKLARLVAYGTAASAVASSATASVTYFNPTDVTTPTTGARLIYFTPSTGAVATSPQSVATSYQFVLQGGTSGPPAFEKAALFRNAQFPANTALTLRTGPSNYIGRLGAGALIGNGGVFAASPNTLASVGPSGSSYGNWTSLGTGFFGIKFGLPDGQHYGWAQITINPDYTITLRDFAYETTPNLAIAANSQLSVPEPRTNSLLALAAGAAGLAAYRSRRRAA